MELPTRYTPADHEAGVYELWEASGGFQPRPPEHGERTFTVMIPPPNVTGVLHMGHALNNTIQDIVIRHRRMNGFSALWVPGTDHAGIATQSVVERMLLEERQQKRTDLGRDAFVAEVWKWREKHGSYILQQFRRLGCSCDWSRTRFTLEPEMSRAVREAFVRLFDKGLVYRGARIVNWDCVLQTAVSDDEIEYVSRKDKLYSIRYPVKGRPGEFVTVATTRPETMLGDTGVAVHPQDERYTAYHGATLVLPLLDREIPLVLDESIEREFGTGAVKVTPGHDPADYERGARHRLPIVNLYEKDGRLNENAGAYKGLSREKARTDIVAKLDEMGLLAETKPYEHNVAVSDRSKSVIEPLVSEQWFVKMKPLAGPAIAAVKTGALKFRPERWTKVYLDWLENVHDWCISRQLWWGHQIPVWYDEDGVPTASREDLAIGSKHPKTGKPIVRQDPDVLDTWASSWLWPFATLGWPDITDDLQRFYPTQFLSTARDILYLWVARMVMAGYEFQDHLPESQRCPFETCYVHATVLDAKGRRMSKSLGNGIDPIEMIDKYGADAVRYSLILLTKEGQDVKLSPDRFEQGWRFGNKVWNAARFVLMNLEGERGAGTSASAQLLEDRWILSRLAATRAEVSLALEEHRYNEAATELYRFVWNDFCDWYLEIVKPRMLSKTDPTSAAARGVLARVLADSLALLHPFTPYMTEVLTKALNEQLGRSAPMLMNSKWPDGAGIARDAVAEEEMLVIQDYVRCVREIRDQAQIGEREPLATLISNDSGRELDILIRHSTTANAMAFTDSLGALDLIKRDNLRGVAVAVIGTLEVNVPIKAGVAISRESFEKRAVKTKAALDAVRAKLSNDNFVERADPEVVEGERTREQELARALHLLERNLERFP